MRILRCRICKNPPEEGQKLIVMVCACGRPTHFCKPCLQKVINGENFAPEDTLPSPPRRGSTGPEGSHPCGEIPLGEPKPCNVDRLTKNSPTFQEMQNMTPEELGEANKRTMEDLRELQKSHFKGSSLRGVLDQLLGDTQK